MEKMNKKIMFMLIMVMLVLPAVSAVRLPTVNGDSDAWGTVLNEYLSKLAGDNATYVNVTGNITLGEKITFTFGEMIDNLVDGWIKITGNLNVTENITAQNFLGNWNGSSLYVPYTGANKDVDLGIYNITNYSKHDDGTAQGQMAFWDGSKWVHTETSEMFWDDVNKRLGVGTASPNEKLDVKGNLSIQNSGAPVVSDTPFNFETSVDILNSGRTALYIYPRDGTNYRLNFGKAGREFYSINFNYVSYLESVPVFATPDYFFHGYKSDASHNIGRIDTSVIIKATGADSSIRFLTDPTNAVNTERVRIDKDGNVGIGTTSPNAKLEINGTGVLLNVKNDSNSFLFVNGTSGNVGIGTTEPSGLLHLVTRIGEARFDSYSDSVGGKLDLELRRARGTSTSPAIIQEGDAIGDLRFYGFNGSNFHTAATVRGEIDGVPGASNMPGKLIFSTTPNGSTTRQDHMTIKNNGNIGIGTIDPAYPLTVMGNVSTISIWSDGNVSATGYITRTSVFDKNKNVWNYVKDSDYYKTPEGKIDHEKFYGYVKYKKSDTKTPIEKEYEEGVELGAEIDVLRQAVYELKQELNALKNEKPDSFSNITEKETNKTSSNKTIETKEQGKKAVSSSDTGLKKEVDSKVQPEKEINETVKEKEKEIEEYQKKAKKEKKLKEISEGTIIDVPGNIIKGLFNSASNFFIGITGKVSFESENTQLKNQVSELKELICLDHPDAEVCKEELKSK